MCAVQGFKDGVAEGYKMATGSIRGRPGAAGSVSSIRSMDVSQIGTGASGRMHSIADEHGGADEMREDSGQRSMDRYDALPSPRPDGDVPGVVDERIEGQVRTTLRHFPLFWLVFGLIVGGRGVRARRVRSLCRWKSTNGAVRTVRFQNRLR